MMKFFAYRPLGLVLAALLSTAGLAAPAPPAPPVPPAAVATGTGTEADAAPPAETKGADWDSQDTRDAQDSQDSQDSSDDEADSGDSHDHGHHTSGKHHHSTADHGSQVVNVFEDSVLAAGRNADSVVSVFGNSRAEGTVDDAVVAVFGNTYVDSKIGGDAVAVFGNVELGPHAEVGGDVVTVFGKLRRDPAAVVHGDTNSVFAHDFSASWLGNWFEHCFMYGRPLSLAGGLGWAWGLALTMLALHLFIALLFRQGVERCVTTFEAQPGRSVLAALLAVLLTPVLIVLLCVTVIGIAAIPFALIGLFCVALFGKTVILAWLGGRILSVRNISASSTALPGTLGSIHPAPAVLVGGLLVLALYLVPFFGFVAFNLLGFLGFGAAVYALIHALQLRHAAKNGGAHAAAGVAAAAPDAASEATAAGGAVPPAAAPEAPPVTSDLPRAGFWIRMGALLLDVLLVGVLSSALWISHVYLVLLAIYGAVMWKLRGCTVGGIVFDLRIVRVDGRAVDWETAIVRALSCFLSLAVAGLGFFWIAFDAANQAWHDKIAGTVVVRVPKPLPRA